MLKQYHRRVLLTDEVGPEECVKAGIVLKEYFLLRGMAKGILTLAPASPIRPKRDEMVAKF